MTRAAATSALATLALLSVCCAWGGTVLAHTATPQRPSFSSDTSTTAEGTLELEAGMAFDDAEGIDSPVTLKWGARSDAELFAGISPLVRSGGEDGVGDLVVGGRLRFVSEAGGPSWAVQATAKFPTADQDAGLGSGEVDFFGAGIWGRSFSRTTMVGFYQLGVLGDPTGASADIQHGLAIAAAHPIHPDVSGFVELTGVVTPAHETEEVFVTAGAGYAWRPQLVLDAAVAIGLSAAAQDLAATFGLTVNLGGPGR